MTIVSVAHLEFLSKQEVAIRSIATDSRFQNKGYGKKMMLMLEAWLKPQGIQIIKAHVNPNAENFYRQLGFSEMLFDDVSISSKTIDMGKKI